MVLVAYAIASNYALERKIQLLLDERGVRLSASENICCTACSDAPAEPRRLFPSQIYRPQRGGTFALHDSVVARAMRGED